jgi:hypothetical protein
VVTTAAQMLQEVSGVVDAQLRDLRTAAMHDLRALVDQPRHWTTKVEGKSVDFCIWAELHDADRLAVIVEGRRKFILGISRVVADGFYVTSDGATTPFEQRDLWAHGY